MNQQVHLAAITTPLKGFEDEVHAAMKDGKVPGAAVLILKDGEVLFSQGFGKRNVGTPANPLYFRRGLCSDGARHGIGHPTLAAQQPVTPVEHNERQN